MKFDHEQICTKNNEIEVGKQYQYKEGSAIVGVKLISDNSDKEFIGFTVKVVEPIGDSFKVGELFDVTAKRGHYAFSGMWRLYDSGTYMII